MQSVRHPPKHPAIHGIIRQIPMLPATSNRRCGSLANPMPPPAAVRARVGIRFAHSLNTPAWMNDTDRMSIWRCRKSTGSRPQLSGAKAQPVRFALRIAGAGSLVRRLPWSMGIILRGGRAMRVRVRLVGIRETKAHEYLVRFFVGGLITVAAGLIAEIYGPVIGGLFLAFPSILPASITLVQRHAEQEERGKNYRLRERIAHQAAGVTAAGTTLGGAGLLCFAITIWACTRACRPGSCSRWQRSCGLRST